MKKKNKRGKLSPRNYLPTKSFSKQEVQHHSSFSSQTKRDEQKHKQEREIGIKKKEGISKTRDGIIKDEESSHQLKSSSINKDFKNLRSNSLQQGENDKGLLPTKDDGPWHMLRRKGVP